MIAVAYQENMSYGQWASSTAQRLKTRILCFIKQPQAPPCAPHPPPAVYGPLEKVENPCGEQGFFCCFTTLWYNTNSSRGCYKMRLSDMEKHLLIKPITISINGYLSGRAATPPS